MEIELELLSDETLQLIVNDLTRYNNECQNECCSRDIDEVESMLKSRRNEQYQAQLRMSFNEKRNFAINFVEQHKKQLIPIIQANKLSKINAIRAIRSQFGMTKLDLVKTKAIVDILWTDNIRFTESSSGSLIDSLPNGVEYDVELVRGVLAQHYPHKIACIRELRIWSDLGFKDAKAIIEKHFLSDAPC